MSAETGPNRLNNVIEARIRYVLEHQAAALGKDVVQELGDLLVHELQVQLVSTAEVVARLSTSRATGYRKVAELATQFGIPVSGSDRDNTVFLAQDVPLMVELMEGKSAEMDALWQNRLAEAAATTAHKTLASE